ncbi:glutamate synthase [Methanoplanus sp. FWC-SCC4]|uniref:Archaeal glutamate synthase [NADPH] n=1 Tax=Methanochimaera problematica TaxID=2609417 RepID=A0AA97I3H4_9EURY|nr:glutamate synthase-related protein [Methanoplanus sp. FWC-SCC4]WOF15896.1 glutamate synthase [Methanoplanus sp. FWC-SCC4]
MSHYRCNVCRVFEYDSERGDSVTNIKPGTLPLDFPDDWRCPICHSKKTHLEKLEETKHFKRSVHTITCPVCGAKTEITIANPELSDVGGYLGDWRRGSDEIENSMEIIHKISANGESVIEPMRSRKSNILWDDILILGAQLKKIPLNHNAFVSTKTIIGPKALKPLIIETPIIITHMSFGALSKEMKLALAKGSSGAKTAIGSGEGGILKEEFENSYKYIFEYVPNGYSVTDDNLKKVDAVEIKIGQSAKPGMGGEIPAEKVTAEIANIRGFPQGTDIISPANYEDIKTGDDLKRKVDWLREKSGGKPIGIKLAAGNIEGDLEVAVYACPDFITVDGRPGATGAAKKIIKDATSVPTIYALYRARKYLDFVGAADISLIITGGLRISSDFAKAIAIGADAVAIGTSALMSAACQQYRLCDTGKCPVGVTTQSAELRKRLKVDISAKKVENFLQVSTEELKEFSRLTGNNDVHEMSVLDLCTTSSEISENTNIPHV